MTDFAVVVGVARYPQLSAEGVAADLEGPNNDAQAVRNWLVDPEGGRLDVGNVRLICSAEFNPFDPLDPQPAVHRIERELKWIEEQTRQTPGGRLYLYFSGHGFAPVLEEGALFTAEATQISPTYVYAHAWLRWFRKAQRFRESVLWMDCCMNYQQSVPVNEVPMRVQIGTGVPGPAFIALAAQTKSALERRMPDGQVHGVFTWTLLQGLRGGACDERGRVTGESLKSFLYTVLPDFLPDDARRAASVDLQPFVRADDGMVFRRLPARPKHRVQLTVPAAAVGTELRIWTGRPLAQVVSEVLTGEEWTGALVRGLYVAEVPVAGLRHGLQVTGAGDVAAAVTLPGPPVVIPDESDLFYLDVVADNAAAAISVTDYRFDRIFSETGELHERELPGVYKVRVEFGRDIATISDEVLLLDRDARIGPGTAPQLLSPAPIPGSALTHEFHVEPFSDVAERRRAFTGPAPGLAAISVISRYWTDPSRPRSPELTVPHPMEGLQLIDRTGELIAELSQNCQVDDRTELDQVAVWERELPPGAYFLRQVLPDGRRFEGCLVASPNWVTQFAIRRAATDFGNDGQATLTALVRAIGEAAVFMRPAGGMVRASDQDAVIEGARMALAQGRNLFADGRGARLQELLLSTYADPIARIIGCHLLVHAMKAGQPDPAWAELFDNAVTNARETVASDHPDVEALSLRCANTTLRATRPFTVPPMFSHSWQLISEASYERPQLVPAELWQRVHAATRVGPFFVWASDDDTRAVHARQLSEWIGEYDGTAESLLPDEASETARRLQVPAAAAAALWEHRTVS